MEVLYILIFFVNFQNNLALTAQSLAPELVTVITSGEKVAEAKTLYC